MSADLTSISDYREILKYELNHRQNRNPVYSLRAFARDLRLSPSMLSDVINGNHGLSKVKARTIGKRLNFNVSELDYFCDLVEYADGRSNSQKQLAKIRLGKHKKIAAFSKVQADKFRLISDWYHFAILEMINLEQFRLEYKWIAKQLRIAEKEVEDAIERLCRLGYISIEDGKIKELPKNHFTGDEIPSKAIREHHEQMIAQALQALNECSHEKRAHSSWVVAMNEEDLPAARVKIRGFEKDFMLWLAKSTGKKQLFAYINHFFEIGGQA